MCSSYSKLSVSLSNINLQRDTTLSEMRFLLVFWQIGINKLSHNSYKHIEGILLLCVKSNTVWFPALCYKISSNFQQEKFTQLSYSEVKLSDK